MKKHIIVANFNSNLFEIIKEREFVVWTNSIEQIDEIQQRLSHKSNHLYCIALRVNGPLSAVCFNEKHKHVPIALFVQSMGAFRELAPKLGLLRQMNIRIYFNTDTPENFTNIRILSSMGIATAIDFGKQPINWDTLDDIMHYAIYSKSRHASIEPFRYLIMHYNPTEHNDFSSVYFNDPTKYIHIDTQGNIAPTYETLKNKEFIAQLPDGINFIEDNIKYQDFLNAYRERYFLEIDGCAYCPAWRVCLGKFSESEKNHELCKKFFSNVMDALDFIKNTNQKAQAIWQS